MIVTLFELVGRNEGRSSKSTMKFPCSPHPAVGVAVGDEGGKGLLAVGAALAGASVGIEVWMVKSPAEVELLKAFFVVEGTEDVPDVGEFVVRPELLVQGPELEAEGPFVL